MRSGVIEVEKGEFGASGRFCGRCVARREDARGMDLGVMREFVGRGRCRCGSGWRRGTCWGGEEIGSERARRGQRWGVVVLGVGEAIVIESSESLEGVRV
jgi:hypothetical protein